MILAAGKSSVCRLVWKDQGCLAIILHSAVEGGEKSRKVQKNVIHKNLWGSIMNGWGCHKTRVEDNIGLNPKKKYLHRNEGKMGAVMSLTRSVAKHITQGTEQMHSYTMTSNAPPGLRESNLCVLVPHVTLPHVQSLFSMSRRGTTLTGLTPARWEVQRRVAFQSSKGES